MTCNYFDIEHAIKIHDEIIELSGGLKGIKNNKKKTKEKNDEKSRVKPKKNTRKKLKRNFRRKPRKKYKGI